MSLAELFYLKESLRAQLRTWRQACLGRRSFSVRHPRPAVAWPSLAARFTLESLEPRVLLSGTPTELAAQETVVLEPAAVTVPQGGLPSLDVDLNGQADALTDGLLLLRHLFGFTGEALTGGVLGVGAQRNDAAALTAYLTSFQSQWDVDLNGQTDALTDGLLIVRSLFGFTGPALTNGVLGPNSQRADPAAIAAFLDNLNPAREHAPPLVIAGLQQDTGRSATDRITFDPTFTGTVTDLNAIETFTVGFDATPVASYTDVLTDLLPTGTFILSAARLGQVAGGTVADGPHTLHLRLTDARGNLTTLDQPFTLDRGAPTGSLTLAAASDTGTVGDRLTTLGIVTLTGQTDPFGTITIGGNSVTADATGFYAVPDIALVDGTNAVAATFTDVAGNQRQVVQTVTRQSADGSILLREGTAWIVDVTTPIDLATPTGTRTLRLTLAPQFDTTDTTAVAEDTFLISLVNPSDPSDTLLDRGTNGTAVFALHGTTAEYQAGQVTFDGTDVTIDLTSLGTQTTGLLRLQVLNHDRDTGSQVRVQRVSNTVDPAGTPPAVFPLTTTLVTAGGAVDLSAYSVTSTAHVDLENVRIDPTTGRYRAELRLHNMGAAIGRQAVVRFPTLPAGVSLRNPSGVDAQGRPYLNLQPALPSGGLGPQGFATAILLEFDNPAFSPFALTAEVLVGPPNQAPVLPPVAPQTVFPGGHLEIPFSASDADGDRVQYFVTGATPLPTSLLTANGTLIVTPAPGEEGTYQFTVVASDGVLTTSQPVTLTVAPDPTATTRISGTVVGTTGQPLAGVPIEVGRIVTLTDAQGRFTLELPSILVPTDSFNITIPTGDVYFDPFNTGAQFITMRRAGADPASGTSVSNPLEHPNLVTSWLDANMVYGSDPARALALRTLQGGQLKTSAGDLLPFNTTTFFPTGPLENDNGSNSNPGSLMVAGDVRASENVALAALHTVLLREHNRLAADLATAHPGWTDEQLYQGARRWLVGELQQIVYTEYLPVLLGPDALPAYTGYHPTTDPAVSALFATAAFRFGHSQMVAQLLRLEADGTPLPAGPLNLRDAFFTTAPITADGIEPLLRGLLAQQAQDIDTHVIDELRNFLFGPPGSGGQDLVSLNIQRGRDMGLPSYVQARLDFGLTPVTSFSQITSNTTVQQQLQAIYGTVDRIDAWVGGLAEDHAPNAVLGPLFQRIIADQFARTRDADRFWYENGQFTAEELIQLRATTLAAVLTRNTGLTNLSGNLFTTQTAPTGPAPAGTAAATVPTEGRSADGSGNNLTDPTLGQTGTNLATNFTVSYGDGISTPGGAERPGAREISNAVFAQAGSIPNTRGLTALAVFFGQILDHDLSLTATGITDTIKIHGDQAAPAGTYPFVAEKLPLMLGHDVYAGMNNVIARPIYLPAIDLANADAVSATQDTVVDTAAIPGARVTIAAGTLQDREGHPFTGLLSITQVPSSLTPATLPPNLNPDLVVTIQPADMVLTTPAPISFPNTGGYAPGDLLDLWSINPLTGQFDLVGTMQVSADGTVIETITGGIRNSSWHFAAPPEEAAPPEMLNNTSPSCDCNTGNVISDNTPNYRNDWASEVSLYTGEVTESHGLVSYQSQGVTRGEVLIYSSLRADPRPIIQLGASNVIGTPDRYFVGRLVVNDAVVPGGTMPGGNPTDAGWHFWEIPETAGIGTRVNIETALQADLSNLPTGMYSYRATYGLQNHRSEETIGDVAFPERFVGSTSSFTGEIVSINQIHSSFGAGWGLAGLQRIYNVYAPSVFNVGFTNISQELKRLADRHVILDDGGGGQLVFEPTDPYSNIRRLGENIYAVRFGSPVGDFSALELLYEARSPIGGGGLEMISLGLTRTMTDGSVYRYDSDGFITSMTDRNGNVTRYTYENFHRLASIIDPVGLTTTLTYTGDRVTAIIDPAGRMTQLEYDSAGNLIRVTNPDGSQRTWSYDTRHHMVGEIDERGNSEQELYDFAGRATAAIRKDGTRVSVSPVDTRSLFRPELTSDWRTAPTANVREATQAALTLPNGNVIRTFLDTAGQATLTLDSLGQRPAVQRDSNNLIVRSTDAAGNVTFYTYDDRGNLLSTRDSFAGGNHIVAGIAQPGEQDPYTFHLEQDAALYFDALTNNSELRWSLIGPTGAIVTDRLFTLSDGPATAENPILQLVAGEYTLTVDGVGAATGSYEFSLLDLSGARPIALNQNVSGTLTPANASDLYRFEGRAGQYLLLNPLSIPANVSWKLIDPTGQGAHVTDPIHLTMSGTYTLIVEGGINSGGVASIGYGFALVEYQAGTLAVGETVNALSDRGQALTFTVTAGSALFLDFQGTTGGFTALLDANGRSAFQTPVSAPGGDWDLNLKDLSPGDYTAFLLPQASGFPQQSVRLLETSNAPELTFGNTVSGLLNPGSRTDIYQFTANAGERFRLEYNAFNLSQLRVNVIAPSGYLAWSGSAAGGTGFIETDATTVAGSYKITVTSEFNASPVDYHLTLRRVVDDVMAITVGELVAGNIAGPGDRHRYTFTVDAATEGYFDALSGTGNILWSVARQDISFVNNGVSNPSTDTDFAVSPDNAVLNLSPGTYEVTVRGRNGATGQYSFRLLDLADALAIAIGDSIDVTPNPVSETLVYQFDGTAAQQISFSALSQGSGTAPSLRLIAPGGQNIYGVGTLNDVSPLQIITLPYDGLYTLLVEGPLSASTTIITYNVTLIDRGIGTLPDPVGTPMEIGFTVNGNIAQLFEQNSYRLSITDPTRLYFDALTTGGNFLWSLRDAAGDSIVANRRFVDSNTPWSGIENYSPLLNLLPGGYTLTITGESGATGNYAFRLLDFESAEALTIGQQSVADLQITSETHLYRFDAQVGDHIALLSIPLGDGTNPLGFYTRIVDPSGAFLSTGNIGLGAINAFALQQAGTYTVLVEGAVGTGQYGVLVQPYDEVTASLNTVITGTVGRAAIYTVMVPSRTQIYFDALTPSDTVRLSVVSPDGYLREYNSLFSDTDAFEFFSTETARAVTLEPGTYRLLINGVNDLGPDPYAFRILELSQATTITPGAAVEAALTPGTEAQLYRFAATAGDQFFFDRQSVDAGAHLRWTLIDSDGVLLVGRTQFNQFLGADLFAGMADFADIETQTLLRTGMYTLLIDGQGPSSAPVNYRFNVQPYDAQPLQLGTAITGIHNRGGRYTFTLASATQVYMDMLSGGSGFNWSLIGANGPVVSNRSFGVTDGIGQSGNPLVDVVAGTYTLVIDGSNDAAGGAYAFRLLDVSSSPMLTRETPVAGTLSPGSATALYRFEGAAGERVYLDVQTFGSSGLRYIRALDPDGRVVALLGPQGVASQATITLPTAGQYRVFLEGAADATEPLPFTLAIRSVADGQETLLFGARIARAITGLGEQDRYTFAGTAGQQLLFNGLSLDPARFDARLQRPDGTSASLLQGGAFNTSPIRLDEGGTYAIVISGRPNAGNTTVQTGSYEYRVLNLATAAPVALGTPKVGQLNPGSEIEMFGFAGTAGQRVNLQGLSASSPNAVWRLLGTRGQTLAQGQIGTNLGPVTLPTSGRYIVVVEGTSPGGAPVDYSILVQDVSDAPVVAGGLGIERNGTLAAGQVATYTFTGSAGSIIYLDRLETAAAPITVEITNPDGVRIATALPGSEAGPFVLDRSGAYTVTVRGVTTADSGSYQFQLLDVAAVAQDLSIGTIATGTLLQGTDTVIYRVTGAAGNRWWFDGQALPNPENPTIAVLSPTLAPLYTGRADGDAAIPTLTETGTYYVLVNGHQTGPAPYAFRLINEQAAPLIAGNSDTTGTLSSDMATDLYRISALAGERLFFQGVSAHAAGDGIWSLYGPHRELLFTGTGTLVNDVFEIQAQETGTYTLVIAGRRGLGTPMAYEFQSSSSIDILNTSLDPSGDPRATGDGRLFTYESTFNQLTSMTDEFGRQTLFEIDPANGNITQITRVVGPLGGPDDVITQFSYTPQGLVDLATDASGRITDYDYDAFGRLTTITFAEGTVDQGMRRFEYDLAGNVTASIDENNHRTEFEYDAMNRLTVLRDALGHETRFTYDLAGNVVTVTDARNHATTNEFDVLNRLVRSTDALSGVTTYAYDQASNLTTVTDPLGHSTRYEYDLRNRLTATIAPDQSVTRFGYDVNNNLRELIDPVGNRTLFLYDGRDRLVQEIDPLGMITRYAYDSVNNLVETTDRNGEVMQYFYDDLDRLVGEQWVNDGNFIVSEYDQVGNLLSIVDQFSSLSFTYDNRNRVRTVDNNGTPNTPRVALNYVYDGAGNILAVNDSINGTAAGTDAYTYDELNRMTRVTQAGNGVTDKRADFTYNEIGQFNSMTRYSDLAGGQTVAMTNYVYDALNRVTNISHRNAANGVLNHFDLEYDAGSRITHITDIDGTTDYNYDETDQLTAANHADANNPDETYEYDENGNRISSSLHGTGYVTGPGNRLLSDGTFDYVYDGRGSLVRRTEIATGHVREFVWDQRGRLVEVDDRSANGAPTTQVVKFAYDALNRRISKTVDADGAGSGGERTTQFVYDGENVLLDFVDADGPAGPAGSMLAMRYLFGPAVDQVLAQQDAAGNVLWMLTDHLGTVRDLINNASFVLNHLVYDSFGMLVAQTDVSMETRYEFTGREFDEESGLLYYRARYMDSSLGRFIQEDSIFTGNKIGYAYVSNDPLNALDPSGHVALPRREDSQSAADLFEKVNQVKRQLDRNLDEILEKTRELEQLQALARSQVGDAFKCACMSALPSGAATKYDVKGFEDPADLAEEGGCGNSYIQTSYKIREVKEALERLSQARKSLTKSYEYYDKLFVQSLVELNAPGRIP